MVKKRILVVDDEPKIVKAIQIRLEQDNYEVLVAYDGKEGLKKAKKYRPDLIVLDVLMPEMDGSVMAAALKKDKETQNIPIIFLTCLAEGVTTKAEKYVKGEAPFLGKPFETKELISIIESLLKGK